ncbi:glycosyltransferase [Labilibaculum antarcticum]|uniref:Glycosyl transferase family 1 domain-containing protein n=1 Tax=Labilibaculum antarcticum TaxID=1717717 RepID=A0A1Y1CQH8_9BACT|nr:glycosyltransferase [Labilibaculum antarcticum]BAX82635.1 hypothetical protein ALGA_4345 [Labilibaculum antarcticum]
MKKITILVDQFYEHGGIEKLVAIKANYWATNFEYDLTVISTENKNNSHIYDLEPTVKFIDLKINYNRLISYFSFTNLFLLFKNIFVIQKYLLKNKPDIVIVASHIPITYVLPFLLRRQTKIVKEFHFSKYYNKKSELKNKIFNYVESKYDKLVVLSTEERSFYKSSNVEVINNPIISDADVIINAQSKKDLIAATVVRFAPVKRLELLVGIWEKFSNDNPAWRLLIYGPLDNLYGGEIQNLVKEKKMENCVTFKGKTNSVLEELAKSRVVLMSSEQECFPMLILEAQSVGVPVISFDCPTGPRNIINNNHDGILIENDNIDKFVWALNRFSSDEEFQDRLSHGAILNSTKFELKTIMNEWNDKVLKI